MAELIQAQVQETFVIRLLRCRKTHRYFKDGGWTDDAARADTFPNELEAVRACVHNGLQDVELVLRAQADGTDLFCTTVR